MAGAGNLRKGLPVDQNLTRFHVLAEAQALTSMGYCCRSPAHAKKQS